jgi:NAD(P)-dependent dehydrogenase (short-subunit alcohol dehydrogenase family)
LWQTESIYNEIIQSVAQKRIAEPEELTGIALYLASDASSFTTGTRFVIDGGQMVQTNVRM